MSAGISDFPRPAVETPTSERLRVTPCWRDRNRAAPAGRGINCGRRVCAWCKPPRDLGPAPSIPAGKVSHGICASCAAKLLGHELRTEVRPHPAGGWTHAVATGTGSARVYLGNWPSQAAAEAAL